MPDAKRSRHAIAEARRRERRAAARVEAARVEAERLAKQEVADEKVAPAASRHGVSTLRGPRVVVVEGRPLPNNPLVGLHLSPTQTRALRQLQMDWAEVGAGIAPASRPLDAARGSGDPTGAHAHLLDQIATHDRLAAAVRHVGGLWPMIRRTCLDGVGLTTWLAEVGERDRPTDPQGLLRASLDRLASFYWGNDNGDGRSDVRTMAPERAEYLTIPC